MRVVFPHLLAPSCLTHLPTSEGRHLLHKDFLSHGLLDEALLLFFAFFWLCQVFVVGALLWCLDSQVVVQGSVVVARVVSCSEACGILDLQLVSNPRPLYWKADS